MTNYEKHESIKNELIQYGKTYKKQGNTELSKSFQDTASLVKDLSDIYKKNNYSLTDVVILRAKINHHFNYLQRSLNSQINVNDSDQTNPFNKQAVGSFEIYYDFFRFENRRGKA